MALQLGALRDALREAGAADDSAGKAAEEVASYETRLNGLETRMAILMVMVGGLYAVLLPLAGLVLRIAVKLGVA